MEAETCRRELVIQIPFDVVQKESESIAADLARKARVPGFRPGRVPREFVKRRFRDAIREEVAQTLLPKFFDSAVKEQNFSVIGNPSFLDLKFEDDQPLTAKASFEVLPAIELRDYTGLEIFEDQATVTEAEVENAIERRRQEAATYEVVDNRLASAGDLLSVNYEGRDAKPPHNRLLEVKDGIVRVGEERTLPEFTAHLLGARAGDVRQFDVNYPADFPEAKIAGKSIRFRVEVLAVKVKVLPPLDDELAKTASEFSTLEELRSSLRKEIEEHKQRKIEAQSKEKLLDILAGRQPFPIPETLVDERLDEKIKIAAAQFIDQGIDPRKMNIDWFKFRKELREEATKEVRNSLLLGKIAEAEKIEVSDEEIDEAIRALAARSDEAPAVLKTRLTQNGGLDRLRSSRRNQKALDFLYRNAKIARQLSLATPPLPAETEEKHEQQ